MVQKCRRMALGFYEVNKAPYRGRGQEDKVDKNDNLGSTTPARWGRTQRKRKGVAATFATDKAIEILGKGMEESRGQGGTTKIAKDVGG